MGRSLVFLARLMTDGWVPRSTTVRAVCGDEQSAVMLDIQSGIGTITSPDGAYVYLLETTQPPTVCRPKTPLSMLNTRVQRVGNGDTFDFNKWQIVSGGSHYLLNVSDGVIVSSNGSIY